MRNIAAVLALVLIPVMLFAQKEQTLEEFKKYVSGRLPQLSDEQLSKLAELVDSDSSGIIDDKEFEGRMRFVRQMMEGPQEPPKPVVTKDYLDGEPIVLPPLVKSDQANLLLITAGELAEAWVPFARWKTESGILTKILTVRQIAHSYKADNIQEKIRLCVRQHIEKHSTRWVLLGGDSEPGGGQVPGGHFTFHDQEPRGIPTDIVYISPTNWDADGDRLYGEWEDDREAITYPDGSVGLGRVPVRTVADVAAFTDKVIAYESRYPTDQFAKNMIYTSTDDASEPKVRASWDSHVGPVWSGKVSRFFANGTPWDNPDEPGSYALNDANLMKAFNSQAASKYHIHGHGLLDRWILEQSELDVTEAKSLSNKDAYPLITTVSCNTGEYDSKQDPSIVEQMLRVPNAGSVAVVAPLRTGKKHYLSSEDIMQSESEGKLDGTTATMTRYWTLGLKQGFTTGEALMRAKASLMAKAKSSSNYHLCICELNLLGDPTLRFRAESPRTPAITAPSRVEPEAAKLRIKTDAPGATVCALSLQGFYQVSQSDAQGVAEFALPKSGVGELTVTVSGAGLNTAKVKVANSVASAKKAPLPADTDKDGKVTLKEMRTYLAEKLAAIGDEKINQILKLVDKDDNREIDAQEFAARMEAVQKVMSGEADKQ